MWPCMDASETQETALLPALQERFLGQAIERHHSHTQEVDIAKTTLKRRPTSRHD